MTLAVCTPVKNRAWILPHFLHALRGLDTPEHTIFLFLDDASSDGSRLLCEQFIASVPHGRLLVNDTPFGNNRSSRDVHDRPALYHHLATLRNRLLLAALEAGADQLLLIDSDILAAPGLYRGLAAHSLPYVAAVVNNARTIGPTDLRKDEWTDSTNVMDQGRLRLEHRSPLVLNAVTSCVLTGACALVGATAIASGTRFVPGPMGEDEGFCQELMARGIQPMVDTTVRCVHVMRRQQLAAGLAAYDALLRRDDHGESA